MMMIEKNRSESADMLSVFTSVDKNKVKKVKLAIKPTTIPNGLCLLVSPSPIVDDKTIGRIGKIQGESIVTIPAIKAKKINININ